MTPYDDLVRTCMVCRRERPEDKISVHKRAWPGWEEHFPDTCVHVQYCNDDPVCIGVACATGPWEAIPNARKMFGSESPD